MSTVKIQGNVSGTGSITIAAPNTNSDLTMSLPAAGGTIASFASLTNNGVAYVNGSGQPTSGSALTFDGTKLSLPTVLAIKGAQNSNLARIAMTRTDASYSINNETDLRFYGQTTDTESPANILHSMNTGGTFVWNQAGVSELMRLTSTGLGIGTSSPVSKLDVSGNILIPDGAGLNNNLYYSGGWKYRGNGYGFAQYAVGDGTYVWQNAGNNSSGAGASASPVTRITLDSSGNLGLGVTPSAWYSTVKSMQFGSGGSIEARTNDTAQLSIGANYYLDASAVQRYIGSNFASRMVQADGKFLWFTAPSGTAGNAISFTQAMTLDASGNLGIGTTSPTTKLSITDSSGPIVRLVRTSNRFELSADTDFMSLNARDASTYITFKTADTERARIDSSGNLLVGDTTWRLSGIVYAGQNIQLGSRTFIGSTTGGDTALGGLSGSNFTAFYQNGTERARIDYLGNLLIGVDTIPPTNATTGNGSGFGAAGYMNIKHNGTSIQNLNFTDYTSGTKFFATYYINGSAIGSISTNGSTVSYNTSSDYRLKNTIAPMTGALAKVAALKPCTYKWNSDGSDGEGFIAHELAEVVPQCVTGEKDAVDAEGNPVYQGIDTSFLVATLTAAIQELKAQVDAQAAEIAALKGTV